MSKVHKNQLLVEGANDKHVVWSLLDYIKVPETFEVTDCESVEKLISKFSLFLNQEASRIGIVAVVLDADTDLEKRWQSIKNIISATRHYEIPDSLPTDGLDLEANNSKVPKLGVWIMPNNKEKGMLEDFVAMLAEDGDVLMIEAENELNSLEQKGINKYKPVHRPKAKIHTYLAWQDEPGKPMGQAITARILNPEAPIAKVFVDWVNRVFNS